MLVSVYVLTVPYEQEKKKNGWREKGKEDKGKIDMDLWNWEALKQKE